MKTLSKISLGVMTAIMIVIAGAPEVKAMVIELPIVKKVINFFAVKKDGVKTEFYDQNKEKVGEANIVKRELSEDEKIRAEAEEIYAEAKKQEENLRVAESQGINREELPDQPQNWTDLNEDEIPGFFPSAEEVRDSYLAHQNSIQIDIKDRDGNNVGGFRTSRETPENDILVMIERQLSNYYRTYKIEENKKLETLLEQYFRNKPYAESREGNLTKYTLTFADGADFMFASGIMITVDYEKGVLKGYDLTSGANGIDEPRFNMLRFKIDRLDNIVHWPVDTSKWQKGTPLTEDIIDRNGW